NLVQDRLAMTRHLGVDQHHAVLLDHDQRIPAAAEDLVDVVGDRLDRLRPRHTAADRGPWRRRSALGRGLLRCGGYRQAGGDRQCEKCSDLHTTPLKPLLPQVVAKAGAADNWIPFAYQVIVTTRLASRSTSWRS